MIVLGAKEEIPITSQPVQSDIKGANLEILAVSFSHQYAFSTDGRDFFYFFIFVLILHAMPHLYPLLLI